MRAPLPDELYSGIDRLRIRPEGSVCHPIQRLRSWAYCFLHDGYGWEGLSLKPGVEVFPGWAKYRRFQVPRGVTRVRGQGQCAGARPGIQPTLAKIRVHRA